MSRRRLKPGVLAALLLCAGVQAAQPPADAGVCDRQCLTGFVDTYLAALVARDPNRAPIAPDAKFTENGVELQLGDAAWGTVSGRGKFSLYIADPQQGEVAFIGVMTENETRPGILALRLKIKDRQIHEIESVWGRSENAAKALDVMAEPDAAFVRPLPADGRPTRHDLIATANTYFTGLQDNDGKRHVPFTKDCNRIENGTQTTNKPGTYPGQRAIDVTAMGCEEQLNSGFFRVDTEIRERRFRVVDEERGLVFAFVFFDHAGNVLNYNLSTGEAITSTMNRPHTWEIAELFKIEGGKISRIQAVLNEVPYGMKSGWQDCSGPWPRPCTESGPPSRKLRVGHPPQGVKQ